jgi:hypothetical protein
MLKAMGTDPDILVVLTTARTEFEAETLAEALRARGIRAEVFATASSTLQWEAGYSDPIKVMVRRGDAEEAERVRVSLKADSVDIDWDEVETGDDGVLGTIGMTPRVRGSFLQGVSKIGWVLMALALAVFVGGLAGSVVMAAGGGRDLGRLASVAGLAATLVVLWRVTRKR